MEEFIADLAKFFLAQGPLGVLAFSVTAFAGYQTWQLHRERKEREGDREAWRQEVAARRAAFDALNDVLTEIRLVCTSILEISRSRR